MDMIEEMKKDPDLYTYDQGLYNKQPVKGELYYAHK